MKVLSENRVARHEYFIESTIEAGIVLDGGEVKSLKSGKANLTDSFCLISSYLEVFLKNAHIAVYDKSSSYNTKDSKRDRKLLLHKEEIVKLRSKVEQKGLTIVPLKLYFKQALIKLEIGLCQGKHTFDKKRSKMEKDLNREKEREIKNYK